MLRIRDVYPGSRILIFTNPGSRIQASKRHRIRIRKTDQFLNYKSLNQIRILSLLLGVELTEYESIMKKCLWQLLSNPFVWTIVCKEKYWGGAGAGGLDTSLQQTCRSASAHAAHVGFHRHQNGCVQLALWSEPGSLWRRRQAHKRRDSTTSEIVRDLALIVNRYTIPPPSSLIFLLTSETVVFFWKIVFVIDSTPYFSNIL